MKLAEQKKHKKVIINPMVLVVSIGHYIDDPNCTVIDLHCPDLDGIDRDYENIKGFCRLYKYKIYPKDLKIEWTQDEIVEFLKRKAKDLSHNIKDNTKKNKYDSLFVFISGHGYKNSIITSDYKTISKTAIHRIFSSSLPHIRLLPRVFLFDVCAGSQQKNNTSSIDTIDSQINMDIEDSMSAAVELEQMIGKDAQGISNDNEVKEQKTAITEHISGADIDQAAMKNHESVWKNNEKNPDFKLCVVNGANEGFQAKMNLIDGSYLIYELVKRLIKNVSRKNKLFFGDIIGKIQVDLHDKGAQQITSTFNNYTTYLRFEVNNKFYNQVSVTETHDNLGITEMKEEELNETETDNTAKTSEGKPKVKGGKSYLSVPTEENGLLE